MGKASGSTRNSSATSPKGLSSIPESVVEQAASNLRNSIEARRSAEDELRENADDAIKVINKIKVPAVGSTNRVTLPGGYEATIRHAHAGYGKGGILESEIYTPQGERVGGIANHRERFGSNGMAEFGTKSEAARAVREAMVDWIRIRFKGARY